MSSGHEPMAVSGVSEGTVFRPIFGPEIGAGGLQPIAEDRTLTTAAERALSSRNFIDGLSGHSMRVGAVPDLMVAGRAPLQIMTAGGWTSVKVVRRHVRGADFKVWTV